MKQTSIRYVRICPALYLDAFRTTQNSNISKQNIKLFLKLQYVVVNSMLFKLGHKNVSHRAIFKLLVRKARLTSVASQAA